MYRQVDKRCDVPLPRSSLLSVFDSPSSISDLVLVVEGRNLHVNRSILACASAVFDKMLQGHFKEKTEESIPLPGKSYGDIVEMLLCIYPSELKPVSREKVDVLLQLSDEYQIVGLRRSCERFLMGLCVKGMQNEEIVHFMLLGDKYGLNDLMEKTTDIASEVTFRGVLYPSTDEWYSKPLFCHKEYGSISEKAANMYLSKRVHYLEKAHEIY